MVAILLASVRSVGQALRNTSTIEQDVPLLSRLAIVRTTLAVNTLGARENILLFHGEDGSLGPADAALVRTLTKADRSRLDGHVNIG
jgi:hypothetical protein